MPSFLENIKTAREALQKETDENLAIIARYDEIIKTHEDEMRNL